MSDSYAEVMARDEKEVARHENILNIGYLVHPSITATLPSKPHIADIATGTGRFLQCAQELYPQANLDGYDISPALFPKQISTTISLRLLDVKQPIPEELHNQYDLVHLRLLLAAMDGSEWGTVVRNVVQMLKPGGWLQWDEGDYTSLKYYRGLEDSKVATARKIEGMVKGTLLGERMKHGWNTLPEHMTAAGLEPVISDIVSSDRMPETRHAMSAATTKALINFAHITNARGSPGSLADEEVDELETRVFEEFESGCYVRFDIYVAAGRRRIVVWSISFVELSPDYEFS
ncbi:hypothetical protein M406DRAFT_75232 [Cryphonectria parasitica EP155]|uniref:Methyltransferase type 12 domain-containing protein n=1 Tax=Cryphonectria parasitica (strain ATCC 38755 / EP155) TaxID=660469 RepID=A0A9P4Y086_CRYP1|nr:uncharacterized protein M406DRAFT_75232 [Cryphonectria parasitica EP155]KAF3764007.1 hypothetical protein M406DRAFT_75232 [Cryphonectria parasitica EP155]